MSVTDPKRLAIETVIKNATGSDRFIISWVENNGQINNITKAMTLYEHSLIFTLLLSDLMDQMSIVKRGKPINEV